MSEGERAFATDLFGPGFRAETARISRISGDPPEGSKPGKALVTRDIEPKPGVCDRKAPSPGRTAPPPAFAFYNTVKIAPEWYRRDMMAGWPDRVLIPESLIVAHELVHVWQWQNRARTRYNPLRAVVESVLNADPYFYRPGRGEGFLSYGYEQQAALVEDYLCYALYDPRNPRRADIRAILAPVFTMDRLDAALRR